MKEERLLEGLNERLRDVRQGPDGALYLVTDNSAGRILKSDAGEITPARVRTCGRLRRRPPRSAQSRCPGSR